MTVQAALAAGCGSTAFTPDAGSLDAGSRDAQLMDAQLTDAQVTDAQLTDASDGPDGGPPTPRLLALSHDGRAASIDLAAPWTVRATAELGATVESARCRGGVCLVVHPSPADRITVLDAVDLSVRASIALEAGADPRDVAILDDRTAVVSQAGRAELLVLDLVTRTSSPIDLAALADADGLPEAGRMAFCGRRVLVQLDRVDHETGAPAEVGAALAVVDLDRAPGDRIVDADPEVPGAQGIALADRPAFDMPVDCAAGVLHVVEPRPLFAGGGRYERVDLTALTASEAPIEVGAQLGGFEIVEPGLYWRITHTDFGPGASSHLTFEGGPPFDAHNTFSGDYVDDLALDRAEDLLFFPDPCSTTACQPGVYVFDAHSGERLAGSPIDVGFPPLELAIAR